MGGSRCSGEGRGVVGGECGSGSGRVKVRVQPRAVLWNWLLSRYLILLLACYFILFICCFILLILYFVLFC